MFGMPSERRGIRFLGFMLWLISSITLLSCGNRPVTPPMLGVLEDIPLDQEGGSHSSGVRVLFQKLGKEWRAFPTCFSDPDRNCWTTIMSRYPARAAWHIGYAGKMVGHLDTVSPTEFSSYGNIGMQTILSGSSIPTVGERSKHFGTWMGSPLYRPLIANTNPNFEIQEEWKPSQSSAANTTALQTEFRKKYPDVTNCKTPDAEPAPWKYRDSDIQITNVFASKRGWTIAEVFLGEYHCSLLPDEPFEGHWYAISSRGELHPLGAEMYLLDSGDYDSDGEDELIFVISGYNSGGYRLFYDDFRGKAEFGFSYH